MTTQTKTHTRAVLLTGLAVLAGCAGGSADAAVQDQPAIGATQMLADVAALSADSLEGRRVGSAGNRIARGFIIARFERLGIRSFDDSFAVPFPVRRDEENLETW